MRTGSWVKPERVTVRDFLEDEWLPTQLPPTLEESTHTGSARDVRIHVVPYIESIPLQQLTPMYLSAIYRKLLDGGRCTASPPRRQHKRKVVDSSSSCARGATAGQRSPRPGRSLSR